MNESNEKRKLKKPNAMPYRFGGKRSFKNSYNSDENDDKRAFKNAKAIPFRFGRSESAEDLYDLFDKRGFVQMKKSRNNLPFLRFGRKKSNELNDYDLLNDSEERDKRSRMSYRINPYRLNSYRYGK